jgi:hypothetical protein
MSDFGSRKSIDLPVLIDLASKIAEPSASPSPLRRIVTEAPDPMSVRGAVERYLFEIRVQGKFDLVPEVIAPMYTRHFKESHTVPMQAFAHELEVQHQELLKFDVQVHDMAVSGDRCWWRGTITRTMKDGRTDVSADLGVYRIEDGKLAELWGWGGAGPGLSWPEYRP